MIHDKRIFRIGKVDSAEELAEKLTQYSWCLCNGFEYKGLFFLNDAFSEDGAAEFAVFRGKQQIESITFSWCSEEKALDYINKLVSGELGDSYGEYDLNLDHPAGSFSCHHCA